MRRKNKSMRGVYYNLSESPYSFNAYFKTYKFSSYAKLRRFKRLINKHLNSWFTRVKRLLYFVKDVKILELISYKFLIDICEKVYNEEMILK